MNHALIFHCCIAVEQKLEVYKKKAEKKQQEINEAEAASQEGNEGEAERKVVEELAAEATEASTTKKELEIEVKQAKEPHKSKKKQIQLLEKQEKKAIDALSKANKNLQTKRDDIAKKAGSAESEQARRNAQLREAEEKLAEARSRHSEIKQAVTQSLQDYEKLEPQVLDAKERVSQVERQVQGISNRIKSMESSSGNSLDVFGQRCAKVKQLVDRAISQRKFRGPVVGPIGFYCKVNPGKEQFAALAESALGPGVLDRFVVCNDGDRKLFQKIRREANCQSDCGVFQQAQHSRYNLPASPEIEGIETIHTVLSVQNDLVFNCLVDNCKIDEKALTRSKDEGEQKLLIRGEHGRKNSIRGNRFKEVFFLPKGDNWKITKGGNIQMMANTRPRMKQSIGVDMLGAIREAKIELDGLLEERNGLNREYGRLEVEHTAMKKAWNGHKKELLKNQKIIDDTQMEIETVKESESAVADNDEDTSMEEQDVREAQEELDSIRENLADSKKEVEEERPHIEELDARLKEVTTRNEKVLADLNKAEQELTQFYALSSQRKEKIDKKRSKLDQYNQVIDGVSGMR